MVRLKSRVSLGLVICYIILVMRCGEIHKIKIIPFGDGVCLYPLAFCYNIARTCWWNIFVRYVPSCRVCRPEEVIFDDEFVCYTRKVGLS